VFSMEQDGVLSHANVLSNDVTLGNSSSLIVLGVDIHGNNTFISVMDGTDGGGTTFAGRVGDGATGIAGVFVIFPNGTLIFDPSGDFDSLGTDEEVNVTFVYRATDSDGRIGEATVTITVTGSNDVHASDDSFLVVSEGSGAEAVLGNVLANDFDPENHLFSVSGLDYMKNGTFVFVPFGGLAFSGRIASSLPGGSIVAGRTGGDFVIYPNGTLTFSHGADFDYLSSGQSAFVEFVYRVTDEQGGVDVATVTVAVNGTNGLNVYDDRYEMGSSEGSLRGNVLSNDSDPEGHAVVLDSVDVYGNGTFFKIPGEGWTFSLAGRRNVTLYPNGNFPCIFPTTLIMFLRERT